MKHLTKFNYCNYPKTGKAECVWFRFKGVFYFWAVSIAVTHIVNHGYTFLSSLSTTFVVNVFDRL